MKGFNGCVKALIRKTSVSVTLERVNPTSHIASGGEVEVKARKAVKEDLCVVLTIQSALLITHDYTHALPPDRWPHAAACTRHPA